MANGDRLPWDRHLRFGRASRAKRLAAGAEGKERGSGATSAGGSSREEAAKAGGIDRQTLRDWVIRF
jgi:hypothetical protein